MKRNRFKYFGVLVLAVLVLFTAAACDLFQEAEEEVESYQISGLITIEEGEAGAEEVALLIEAEEESTIYPEEDGEWSAVVEEGEVTVTPSLESYEFDPENWNAEVTEDTTEIDFSGSEVPEIEKFEVTFEDPGEGELSAEVGGELLESGDEVEEGSEINFTVEPVEGYLVVEWMVNDEVIAGEIETEFTYENLDKNIDVSVTLAEAGALTLETNLAEGTIVTLTRGEALAAGAGALASYSETVDDEGEVEFIIPQGFSYTAAAEGYHDSDPVEMDEASKTVSLDFKIDETGAEITDVQAITAEKLEALVTNLREPEEIEAGQFLFFDDPDEMPDDPANLDEEDFITGESLSWEADSEVFLLDFAQEINKSGETHGLMLLSETDREVEDIEILASYQGIFLDYLTFQAGDIEADAEAGATMEVTFSQDIITAGDEVEGLNANDYFQLLDGDLDVLDEDLENDWGGTAFAEEFAVAEDLRTVNLATAPGIIEAGEDYIFQVNREEVRAVNSARLEQGQSTAEISTPAVAEVEPALVEGEITSKYTVALQFERPVTAAQGDAVIKVDDHEVEVGNWKVDEDDASLITAYLTQDDEDFQGFAAGESYQLEVAAGVVSDEVFNNAKNPELSLELAVPADTAPEFTAGEMVLAHDVEGEIPAAARAQANLVLEFDRPLDENRGVFSDGASEGDVVLVDSEEDTTYSINEGAPVNLAENKENTIIIEDLEANFPELEITAGRDYELQLAAGIVYTLEFEEISPGVLENNNLENNNLGNEAVEDEYVEGIELAGPALEEVKLAADGSLKVKFDRMLKAEMLEEDKIEVLGFAAEPGENPYQGEEKMISGDSGLLTVELVGDVIDISPAYDFVALFTGNTGEVLVLEIPGESIVAADNLVYGDKVEFEPDSEKLVDRFAPVYLEGKADYEDDKIVLTFSELLEDGEVPTAEQFTVEVYDETEGWQEINLAETDPVEVSGRKVTLRTTAEEFAADEAVRVSYSKNTSNIQDLAGNLAAELDEVEITGENL